MPLGFLKERYAALVWSLSLVASLACSIRMIWAMEGRQAGRLHLVGYMFPPALECLTIGQVGIFMLLGVTGFLYLHRTRPMLAGVSLTLCSLKPHLFLLVIAVLLLWCVERRAYRVLAGMGIALAACLVLVQLSDPLAWSQYSQMMKAESLAEEPIPTVSLLFRAVISLHTAWLQFVPTVIAVAWAIWYFRRSPDWSWGNQGLLLLTLSVMVAPYVWLTDEAVVLPAMLHGVYRLAKSGRSLTPFVCAVLPFLVAVLVGVPMSSWLYVWAAPAWFGFCLYAARAKPRVTPADIQVAGGI